METPFRRSYTTVQNSQSLEVTTQIAFAKQSYSLFNLPTLLGELRVFGTLCRFIQHIFELRQFLHGETNLIYNLHLGFLGSAFYHPRDNF